VVTDADGTILSVNRAFTELTGYRGDEVIGANPRLLQSGHHDQAFYQSMWASLLSTGHWHGDMWDRHKDGHLYPKYLAISAIRGDSGAVTHYVGIFYDNSERKTIEERLDHLAHYDALTGLPNRSLLMDRLEQAIERARRLGLEVALLYIDLDNFKLVNDDHGHDAGDQLLKTVAQRMRACVRGVDTVARLGGDEFVVLLPETSGSQDVLTVARKLLAELSNPHDLEGHRATCTPSVGISVFPRDSHNADELMKHADTAMYRAKQGGRASFRFFQGTPP
jgi:diguanylate cyclase (GGDEF)-like protein/PAS domain S-box-containing protein